MTKMKANHTYIKKLYISLILYKELLLNDKPHLSYLLKVAFKEQTHLPNGFFQ